MNTNHNIDFIRNELFYSKLNLFKLITYITHYTYNIAHSVSFESFVQKKIKSDLKKNDKME